MSKWLSGSNQRTEPSFHLPYQFALQFLSVSAKTSVENAIAY